eukprot:m.123308 g.123308  ORF g.123308 m.123308 type:complete len:227 (-) comp28980_c0_seq1:1003-1683(-)
MSASKVLDACSGNAIDGLTIEQHNIACSAAIDAGVNTWPIVRSTEHAKVYFGYAADAGSFIDTPTSTDKSFSSLMWIQEFPNTKAFETILHSMFGDNFIQHAATWDSSYVHAEKVGSLKNGVDHGFKADPGIYRYEYRASPLSARDMLYVLSTKEVALKNDTKQTTFAAASVSDDWVQDACSTILSPTGKVRSFNMFPSVTRITVPPTDSGEGIRVEQLMTTRIGG